MIMEFKRGIQGTEYRCVAGNVAGPGGVPAVLIDVYKDQEKMGAVKFLFGLLSPLGTQQQMLDLGIKQFDRNNWLQRILRANQPNHVFEEMIEG